jgi:hypothetical protein
MTISSLVTKQSYSCNGALTSFSFNFPIYAAADVIVIVRDSSGNGTILNYGTQYEISTTNIDYSSGGTLTTVSYVTGTRQLYAYLTGYTITIYRATPLVQASLYRNNQNLDQTALMSDLDKLCMEMQELVAMYNNSIRAPFDDPITFSNLPYGTLRANQFLAFGPTGDVIVSPGQSPATVAISSFMSAVVAAASAAAARSLIAAKSDSDTVRTVIAAGSAVPTDETILCTNASGFTLTLFTAIGYAGKRLNIVNIGTGIITLATTGGQTIGGSSTFALIATTKDGCVIESDGANWQILTAKGKLSGDVIQVVNTQTGAMATGSTIIPWDNTIPQNSEGDQYMSLAITPTSATNVLLIQVVGNFANSAAAASTIMALFQDTGVNALAVAWARSQGANDANEMEISYYMVAGTINSTTFKVRAGPEGAATLTFNGQAGTAFLGGTLMSSITITEIKV